MNRILNPNMETYQTPLVIRKRIVQLVLTVYAALPLFSAWAFALVPKCKDLVVRKYKSLGNAWGE